jgi:hypothetical protein
MIIGIDFSIKSPAVTIQTASGEIHFHSYPRKSVLKEAFADLLTGVGVNMHMLDDEKALPRAANLTDKERSSMQDAFMLVGEIIDSLKQYTQWTEEEIYIAIEGFSFASTGNRLAQISGYQWLLRSRLVHDLDIPVENVWIFAPMTIKATAGKGNFKKEEMIEEFLKEAPLKNPFRKALREQTSSYQKKNGQWHKPIDDIVDSYWVARTLEKTINKV